MTLILGVCGKDFLVVGADSRRVEESSDGMEIKDGVQKLFHLKDLLYFSFSGQRLIPAAILKSYQENRIRKPKTFSDFIEAFSSLARHIREHTPHPVKANQFAVYGFDQERRTFRMVIFHESI